MATRLNTVEYSVASTVTALAPTNNAGGGGTTEATVTVDIPENTSRTFLSVFVVTSCRDISSATATRSSIASHVVGVGIDAVADSDTTVTLAYTDTGDQASYLWVSDFTSYFVTNYTGTSHSVGLRFSYTDNNQASRCSLSNLSQKLVLTYQYDDAAQDTRVKTVWLPIQSYNNALPTSETEWGTNEIPNLSTLLPESTITYKDIFFELTWQGNVYSAATDVILSMETATDTTHNPATLEMANAGDPFQVYIWKRTDLATNAAQAWKMWADQAAFAASTVSVVLVVTYTYSWDSSTSVIHSLTIPFKRDPGDLSLYTTSTTYNREILEFWIPEASPALVQSGVLSSVKRASNGTNIFARFGAQAFRTWTNAATQGTLVRMRRRIHRIDAAGPDGAALALAQGRNELVFDWYSTAAADEYSRETVLLLNYTATKTAAHSRTVIYCPASDDSATALSRTISSWSSGIPEATYWIHGMLWKVVIPSPALKFPVAVHFARGVEGRGQGSYSSAIDQGQAQLDAAEVSPVEFYLDTAQVFKRWPTDSDKERLDAGTARDVVIQHVAGTVVFQALVYLTYHAVTSSVVGDITGSGGGTVNLAAHYAGASSYLLQQGERVATGSRSGSGAYSMTWYDTQEKLRVVADENATHIGASDDTTAA